MATGTTRYRQEYRMSLDTQNWKGYFATMPYLVRRVWIPRAGLERLHVPPEQLGRQTEVADDTICLPQVMGCLPLQGILAEFGRQLEGLPARRNGAVEVSRHA